MLYIVSIAALPFALRKIAAALCLAASDWRVNGQVLTVAMLALNATSSLLVDCDLTLWPHSNEALQMQFNRTPRPICFLKSDEWTRIDRSNFLDFSKVTSLLF